MKKVSKDKKIIFILVLLFVVLSFVSLNHPSYAIKIENNVNNKIPTKKISLYDEKIFDFLESSNDFEVIELYDDIGNTYLASKKEIKEDPSLAVKMNEKEKGKAKKTTAKKAVEKYETNETSLGIDVSTWQGKIDWKKVKAAGINFVMIRCGYRGMDSGEITLDNRFLDNIKGATANNINVGVYFFSMAKNKNEAIEEAKWVVNLIKDYDISYPVAIDTEIFNRNRLKGVSYSTLTNNAIAFCDYIKSKGYTPMIYSYANAFNKYFDTAKFANYRLWLALYNDVNTYKGRHHMWQYTSSGSVPGITGRVDMNVSYFSVTNDATKRSIVNGVYNPGNLEEVIFKDMDMSTKLTKEVNLRISPYNNLPNKAGTLPKDTNIEVVGMNDKWIKIIYEDNFYYINDPNCFEMNLEEIIFEETNLELPLKKDVTLLYKPYLFLNNNEYLTLNEGTLINIIGLNENFIKIIIDDTEYYINNLDCIDLPEPEPEPDIIEENYEE